VVVDAQGWRLYYSQWGGQQVVRHLAAGPRHALRFIEAQWRSDQKADWLDDVWAEGGVVVDTVAQRLLFFGGYEVMCRVEGRRAYVALLEQTWPGWTIGWAYNEIVDIASYVDVDPSVVLDSDPPTLTVDTKLLQRPHSGDVARGDWALLSVRTNVDRIRAWPLKAEAHPVWAGEQLLTLLPRPWRSRRAIRGLPPVYGLHVDLTSRRLGWWTATSALSYELVPGRWPGWTVEFWQDRYEEQIAACAGFVQLPAIDVNRGLDRVEQRITDELDDPAEAALQLFEMLRAQGRSIEIPAQAAAHTEVAVDESERTILADGLRAVRAQLSEPVARSG
jgi:hypothetical protein